MEEQQNSLEKLNLQNIFKIWFYELLISSEAVIWRFSVKKVFLKISQNAHENTCARAAF